MKKTLFLTAFLFFFFIGFSQNQLLIQHGNKGIHLVHKVAPKEGLYALGRLYAISPKEIAEFNGLDVNTGLTIGQTILIPLTEANFSQTINQGTPVYYTVGEKEGLYRVSVKNGNVLMADLRKWNNLSNDAIKSGQKLIIGYITPSETLTNSSSVVQTTSTSIEKSDIVTEKPKAQQAVQVQAETKAERKPEPVAPPAVTPAPARTAFNTGNGGFFKQQFEQQSRSNNSNKDISVTSGIFKTASGWQDAKYYVLADGVEPGTIVRIINTANNKAIFAKVLGGMSGIRQNQGYDIRISNAAASVLDIADTEKFVVRMNY